MTLPLNRKHERTITVVAALTFDNAATALWKRRKSQ